MTSLLLFAFARVAAAAEPLELAADPAGDMVLVPEGPFAFGSDEGEPDARPAQTPVLPAFWIDRTEVTTEAYRAFLEATGRAAPPDWVGGKAPAGKEREPVVNVTWHDAAAFATWAGKRLPTEMEWEKAARGTDGRKFPWGDRADESLHNLREGAKLQPVDSLPQGSSPFGVLHAFGNAWEWCADDYGPYPGSLAISIHFGKKYKVLRGGGAIYLYGIDQPAGLAARARMVAFGRHDAIGFRCARDAGLPKGARRGKVALSVRESGGLARRGEVVTSGVPFPEGAVRSAEELALLDPAGATLPLAAAVTSTWRDGSVRWALLDFPLDLGPHAEAVLTLEYGEGVSRNAASTALAIREAPEGIDVDSGAVRFFVPRTRPGLLEAVALGGEVLLARGLSLECILGKEAPALEARGGPPTKLEVEERNPLRAVIRLEGPIASADGTEVLRYLARVTVRAGSPKVEVTLSFLQLGSEMAWVRRFTASATLESPASRWRLGGDRGAREGEFARSGPVRLAQLSDTAHEIQTLRGNAERGTRAPGWVEVLDARGRGVAFAVEDFWQNFPKALEARPQGVAIDLWAEGPEGPFDADPGIAKTHRIAISPHAGDAGPRGEELSILLERPLVATASADHVCSSRVFGTLAPYDFDVFTLYEVLTEDSADRYLRERPNGMRHFGDFYYGGPYKGKNAYGDLEYDLPLNYAMQYARTGLRKYLSAAVDQARHQADIDTNHLSGMQYKHSPRHVETEAEMGHVFLRGLVAVYHFTGDRRLLEVAREIGDWLGPKVARSKSQGNERQIGWSLYALTGIYEATWDPKYLEWARANVEELVRGMGPTGRFDIRWDNRIAFFQGIAASGFLKYWETTKDDRVAEATLRLCERMLGYYPEYLGRTLEALAWAYETSGDQRYLELLARTYETSMLRAVSQGLELGAGTIFTVHALPFLAEMGLDTRLSRSTRLGARELASDSGLYRHRIAAPNARLLIEVPDAEPFDLVVLRSGATSDAIATVRRPDGSKLASTCFQRTEDLTTRRVIPIRLETGSGRTVLALEIETLAPLETWAGPPNAMLEPLATSWDLVTNRPLRAVFHSPGGAGMETLMPRIFFRTAKDAARLSFRLAARGEGFHGAVVYDPRGKVAAVSANFIDLDDKTAHEYTLEAAVPEGDRGALWALDPQAVEFRIEGAEPYFATSTEGYFDP